ncbi:MAG TPA: haloacid dehalogenase [Chloroflexi bacterium]|nr:haloacid dehalogenase [Chloroflexota bacterium]
MENLEPILERIRLRFEAENQVREETLRRSRELTRLCATAIRASHRNNFDEAERLLAEARAVAARIREDTAAYPAIFYAGYTQDALKEMAEAHITVALAHHSPLPEPEALGVEYPAYLNGLAEAASEMRRRALDIIRRGHSQEAEQLLEAMDTIYGLLVTFDFPDAITGGLRRRMDQLRGVLERTRGDLTLSIRQEQLQRALQASEERTTGEPPKASEER